MTEVFSAPTSMEAHLFDKITTDQNSDPITIPVAKKYHTTQVFIDIDGTARVRIQGRAECMEGWITELDVTSSGVYRIDTSPIMRARATNVVGNVSVCLHMDYGR